MSGPTAFTVGLTACGRRLVPDGFPRPGAEGFDSPAVQKADFLVELSPLVSVLELKCD